MNTEIADFWTGLTIQADAAKRLFPALRDAPEADHARAAYDEMVDKLEALIGAYTKFCREATFARLAAGVTNEEGEDDGNEGA